MPQLAKSRSMTVTTRIPEALYAILEDRCRAQGITQADFLRPLVERALSQKEKPKPDYTAILFDVFAETMDTILDEGKLIPTETFEGIVNKFVPGYYKYEDAD